MIVSLEYDPTSGEYLATLRMDRSELDKVRLDAPGMAIAVRRELARSMVAETLDRFAMDIDEAIASHFPKPPSSTL